MKSDDPILMEYDPGLPAEVPLKLTPEQARRQALKERHRERLAEAKAFETLGYKILSIKNKTLGAIGTDIQKLGIKNIGHGKYAVTTELAEEAVHKLDQRIEQLQAQDPPPELRDLTDLMRLRKEYVALILESGKAHIQADRQLPILTDGQNITIPFPPGTPMMVAVGKTKAIEEQTPKE